MGDGNANKKAREDRFPTFLTFQIERQFVPHLWLNESRLCVGTSICPFIIDYVNIYFRNRYICMSNRYEYYIRGKSNIPNKSKIMGVWWSQSKMIDRWDESC